LVDDLGLDLADRLAIEGWQVLGRGHWRGFSKQRRSGPGFG
jgi:hypothetical protein